MKKHFKIIGISLGMIFILIIILVFVSLFSTFRLNGYSLLPTPADNIQPVQMEVGVRYYQNLKNKCAAISNSFQAECCLDSVKTMEIVGAILFPGGKYEEDGAYQCKKGFRRMTLRCPGSYTWCAPDNGIDDSVLPAIPPTESRLDSGPGFDNDGNGPICTMEAKSCGDGTYVGRTGPKCEFAPCPGEKPTPDFIPTEDKVNSEGREGTLGYNPIQLPSNVITEKDCAAQGGEVWNTLGEISYNGELIGKIEGLLCPCVCLVKE